MKFLAIVAAALLAVGTAACNHPSPPPVITVTPTPSPLMVPHKPVAMFGDGKYVVGTDILAGEYRTNGPTLSDKCYWARLKDFTGAVQGVIAMQYGAHGPDVVVIDPADKGFETRDCGTWTLVAPR